MPLELAIGVSVMMVAAFAGISLLVRTLPPKKKPGLPEPDEVQRRLEEVDQLRQRVVEVEERLDFAERLLAAHRVSGQIPSTKAD